MKTLLRRLPPWVVNGLTVASGLMLVQGAIWRMAGAHAAQAAMATAVCASLADVVTTTDRVARRVFAAVLASTAAAWLFMAARPHEAILIPTVVLTVFGAMLIQAWGPKAGTVSFATTMSLVFAMSVPASQGLALADVAWGLAGSAGYWVWAVATARLLQPTWRRLALAATVQDMAGLLRALAAQARDPADLPLQEQVVQQEAVLAERMQAARDLIFGNADGPAAHLQTSVLLRLADLRDLAIAGKIDTALARQGAASPHERQLFADVLAHMALALDGVAAHVRAGRLAAPDAAAESEAARLLDALERQTGDGRDGVRRAVADILRNQWAHVRAIRAMHDPATQPLLPCRRSDLRRYIAPDEWRFAAVRAALRVGSPTFRYALRTAVAAGAAYAVCRLLPWTAHPQWVLLSVTVVMQGSLAQTLVRRNARVLGTLAGCAVVALLTLSPSTLFLSLCFLVAAGVAHAYLGVRYAVTAAAAAVMAVLQAHLMVHTAAQGADFSILERVADTVVGALVGWAASYAWPSWERRRLPGDLRQATEAIRSYAAQVLTLDEGAPGLPRFARQRAYDAIRAVGAVTSRTRVEPSSVRLPPAALTRWLSAAYDLMSHLSNARLSLTLYAKNAGPAPLGEAVAAVAREVDRALQPAAPVGAPALVPQARAAIEAVPHLPARLQDALADAARLTTSSRELCSLAARG
uniref:FUSC family protein n=1 Tax=unclassified Variovorax TaxID=663243 RepID=UPI000D35BB52